LGDAMNQLIRQLRRWRLRERLVQLAWGGSRWLGVVLVVLAIACFADWLYDRYYDVPLALRLLATGGQIVLAFLLAYYLVVRSWVKAPALDDLAYRAEKAISEFGHRLVTALQLNRPGAKTHGMSPVLIAEVTREAGEMAGRHRLTDLIDYRPARRALAIIAPVLLGWGLFVAVNPSLAAILLQRQALLGGDIPRSVQLENVTEEVWPTGSEVVIRYRVTGEHNPEMIGKVSIFPEGQPADDYELTFEKTDADGSATFASKLPPSSTPFTFRARLADGRTRSLGRVAFEDPPQVTDIEAWQLLPVYLGGRTAIVDDKPITVPYERFQPKGEIIGALPESGIRVEVKFNKPVVKAELIPVERGDGNRDVDGRPQPPDELAPDGRSAGWTFATSPKMIGYRIELTDARGFRNPAPFRRGVRMMPDEPPMVEFQKESTRNPDPTAFDGQGDPRIYVWEMPVAWIPSGIPGEGETGPIQVIYTAQSELGIGRANIVYRVLSRGEPIENIHPRDDPHGRVYTRLPLSPVTADIKKVGKWIPDLGLFEKSFAGLGLYDRRRREVNVELYRMPSPNPSTEPGELEGGGRFNFQTAELRKPGANGTQQKLEVGDTVELYVEVFDKYSVYLEGKKLPSRVAGYTREAKRKIVYSEADATVLIRQRDEAQRKLQDKLRDIAEDQRNVFQPSKLP
jgi:hypothetical protein